MTSHIQEQKENFVSKEEEIYSTEILESKDYEVSEKEWKILDFLNENNIYITNSTDKMHNFFQGKRENVLLLRKQLYLDLEKQRRESDCSSVKTNKLQEFAKRKSLFLEKL